MGGSHPLLCLSPEVRNIIYTTNVIEPTMQLRNIIKSRDHSPNDDAAVKLLCLALRNIPMTGR